MYVCYIDESGTSSVPGNTSHFVLAGLSIPIWHWRQADQQISEILARYELGTAELHTAWMLRPLIEQVKIPNFERLGWRARRAACNTYRTRKLLELQQKQNSRIYKQTKKSFNHTSAYTHLTIAERKGIVNQVADCIGGWGFARLFAECIDKAYFDPARTTRSIDEQAFEQVVSRFETYLSKFEVANSPNYGLLIHDNNQTIAEKHTKLMREFHQKGTLWTGVNHIIETPLFVDSSLTRMVQMADLCSYAIRRYLENDELDLFQRIFPRADRFHNLVVGVRHYCDKSCKCLICRSH